MLRKFFNKKDREKERVTAARQTQADWYVRFQEASSNGRLAPSRRQVAFLTTDAQMRELVESRLRPALAGTDVAYLGEPTTDAALNSIVVILDARPNVRPRLQQEYNKVLRVKKSLGKFGKDLLCVIGPRSVARDYSRGTYGQLRLFSYKEGDPDAREPDIPPEGLPSIEGPITFAFSDIGRVIGEWLSKQSAPSPRPQSP